MKQRKIPTNAEVYAVIMARHKDELKVFSSYSAPDGDYLGGNQDLCRMFTSWGFDGADEPTICIETTWEKDPEIRHKRVNEKHEYWLYLLTEDE